MESPDANEALLLNIKLMMNECVLINVVNKLYSIIAETIKKEIIAAIEPFESKLVSLSENAADLERSINNNSSQWVGLEAKVSKLTTLADSLSKKM